MTNEAIQLVLDRLNSGRHEDVIVAPISKTVWWGFVWGETDQGYEPPGHIQEHGLEFFFVKAKDKQFGAAIYRTGAEELHWYVADKYRRKGLLVQPMKKTVLPFIFERYPEDQQDASVDGPYAQFSAKLARAIGFEELPPQNWRMKFRFHRRDVAKFHPLARPPLSGMSACECELDVKRRFRIVRMAFDRLRVRPSTIIPFPLIDEFEHEAGKQINCAKLCLLDLLEKRWI